MTEQRRARRFELRLPFELIRNGALRVSDRGETRNLSSGGVLFESSLSMQVGDPVEFLITFPPTSGNLPVRLHCVGKVIRMANPTEYAATVERYDFVREAHA